MLYKSQVLPILDYACVACDPHLKKDKESVQHFALKIIDSNNALHLKYLRGREVLFLYLNYF